MPIAHIKLPLAFDRERLQADLRGLGADDWTAHFNQRQYDGEWGGVALRTTVGAHVPLFADPSTAEFEDLPVLARCPYIREVLSEFQCPLKMVRLLRLSAGSNILEHRDFGLCYEDGEVRVHIPIQTNPQVEFIVQGERVVMGEGECWYIDFNLPHRIFNGGESDRVHLVIDCLLNPWLEAMFEKSARPREPIEL